MTSPVPYYTYPGQAFDELGSLAAVMPKQQRLSFDLSNTPGSRDATNALVRAVMQSGVQPYQQ